MRFLSFFCLALAPSVLAAEGGYRSHSPVRPLPVPGNQGLPGGNLVFVDVKKGTDLGDGSKAQPFKTLARAVQNLKPGTTVVLREGIYFEQVALTAQGTPEQPITIRSHPGELVVLDGGLREFLEEPEKAWEPVPNGAPGEFRSVKSYPGLGEGHVNYLGNFADSMVPLHGYRFLGDLRSNNIHWNLKNNVGPEESLYCGPGVYHHGPTGRIHIRLAHTGMKYLSPADNYQGETDPRKLPLVIAGGKGPLTIQGARRLRIQDLVLRGSRGPTVDVQNCEYLEFVGLTVYGGSSCFSIKQTTGVRVLHCACRGLAAPWTFRTNLKYRSIESRLFSAGNWSPPANFNRDFELAYSEFTDSVDGVFIGNVQGVRFHHNWLDNVSDDGIFLTAGTAYDGSTPGGNVHISRNLFTRTLTVLAFGVGHGRQKAGEKGPQTGTGVFVYRNIFDLRGPVRYFQPRRAEDPQTITGRGRFASDHGGPAWEPMTIYHNTLLVEEDRHNHYSAHGLAQGIRGANSRRVFNNIIVQMAGLPGQILPANPVDLHADFNLHWSLTDGPAFEGKLFAKFRQSKMFADSQKIYPPGWGVHDLFADPRFVSLQRDWSQPADLRLQPSSPARDAGKDLPADWPDPLRQLDAGKPDLGALPLGVDPWPIGVSGRFSVLGQAIPGKVQPTTDRIFTVHPPLVPRRTDRAAIVEGYPAPSVPIVEYALQKRGIDPEIFERTWLPTKDYAQYRLVAVVGDLARAKMEPNLYGEDDLKNVQAFLHQGGTLLLMTSGRQVFKSPAGQKVLADWTGSAPVVKEPRARILEPGHPWIHHLDPKGNHSWLTERKLPGEHVLRASKGERILGSPEGTSILYRNRVGKGQLILVGWDIAASLPHTRAKAATLAEEKTYEDQARILFNLLGDVLK